MQRSITFLSLLFLAACAGNEPMGGPPRGPDGPGPRPPGMHGGGALFASPMGEPFRGDRPERQWFAGADGDGDGRLSRAEFRADTMRFFARLDRAHDGEVDPDDIDVYENQLFPELRTGGGGGRMAGGGDRGGPPGGGGGPPGGGGGPGGGGPGGGGSGGGRASSSPRQAEVQGAARFGYLALPEPVTAADANLNRGIDPHEFTVAADDRFTMLDTNHDGYVTQGELPRLATHPGGPGEPGGRRRPD